jgi:hypothetical protein
MIGEEMFRAVTGGVIDVFIGARQLYGTERICFFVDWYLYSRITCTFFVI